MERLTEKDAYWYGEEYWVSAKEPDELEIDDVYMKLKEYEDAEEQGLLLRLPYNLGTCGVLYYACEEDSEVYRLRADEVTISKTMISNKFCYLIDSLEFCFEDFGKIIFRTKAEAEKALAEIGKSKV